MIGGAGAALLSGAPLISRTEFLAGMSAILGANQRLLYVPNGTDTTTSVESSTVGRTITWDATIAARASQLGNGYAQSFNGSTQYGTMPDSATLTFGNGSVDQPVGVVVLANVTDTAASRDFLTKWDGPVAAREWNFSVNGSDQFRFEVYDEVTDALVTNVSTAAIIQGSWCLFGATYDGRGGATAANGVTLYVNGAAVSSTPTNHASYVAMSDTASLGCIGARNAGAVAPLAGSLALVALTQKALTPSEHARIVALSSKYFGLAL